MNRSNLSSRDGSPFFVEKGWRTLKNPNFFVSFSVYWEQITNYYKSTTLQRKRKFPFGANIDT